MPWVVVSAQLRLLVSHPRASWSPRALLSERHTHKPCAVAFRTGYTFVMHKQGEFLYNKVYKTLVDYMKTVAAEVCLCVRAFACACVPFQPTGQGRLPRPIRYPHVARPRFACRRFVRSLDSNQGEMWKEWVGNWAASLENPESTYVHATRRDEYRLHSKESLLLAHAVSAHIRSVVVTRGGLQRWPASHASTIHAHTPARVSMHFRRPY